MHDNKNNSGFGEWEKGTDDSLSSLLVLGTFYKFEGVLDRFGDDVGKGIGEGNG